MYSIMCSIVTFACSENNESSSLKKLQIALTIFSQIALIILQPYHKLRLQSYRPPRITNRLCCSLGGIFNKYSPCVTQVHSSCPNTLSLCTLLRSLRTLSCHCYRSKSTQGVVSQTRDTTPYSLQLALRLLASSPF